MGAQYSHVHTYGLESTREFLKYQAVFGGFLADTLLKGLFVKKNTLLNRFPLYHERKAHNKKDGHTGRGIFDDSTLQSLKHRIDAHIQRVSDNIRNESADEWFGIWPVSMRKGMPNYWGNRRLFPSYEPFLSTSSVKVAAAVPQRWKLNRQLFQKMAAPALYRSKNLLHANGWLPYQSWQVNQVIKPIVRVGRKIQGKLGFSVGNQGPWNDWSQLVNSNDWKSFEEQIFSNEFELANIFKRPIKDILRSNSLSLKQRVNLIQTGYQLTSLGQNKLGSSHCKLQSTTKAG
jgi:hypothetical protein